jgi:hypothetical protein
MHFDCILVVNKKDANNLQGVSRQMLRDLQLERLHRVAAVVLLDLIVLLLSRTDNSNREANNHGRQR